VSPNWTFLLPGAEYADDHPDDFMLRDEIVERIEQYVEKNNLPVQYRSEIDAIEEDDSMRKGYLVHANNTTYQSNNVVVATGLFQQPKVPALARELPESILQLSGRQYRSPGALPPGAVLVVGSAQSGCQIAEDLYINGRKVYLCVGGSSRAPRRYRGRDVFYWIKDLGILETTPDKLDSPAERFASNPQVTGARGGHDINLHLFYREGVVLLGRLLGYEDGNILFAPGLHQNLARTDKTERELIKNIDAFIEKRGINAPPEEREELRDAYSAPEILSLNLQDAGISTIIWANGYSFDFSMVRLPVLDEYGFPITNRGATQHPGLYFVGMPWISMASSGLFYGLGSDAMHIALQIAP
jgi:putative flavoprotein involved in K+ transport